MTNARMEEWLEYLTDQAARKYPDCSAWEDLVQETLLAAVMEERRGNEIHSPRAWLSITLSHKYNDWLRKKYRNRCDLCEDFSTLADETEEIDDHSEEYASVRREIGRLIQIYREVVVRHYVKGQSVEMIANELDIPRGTVLSRLSHARVQVKEGLKMEKYTQLSYEPKSLTMGIWGYEGRSNEPFCFANSLIDANALILAYEKPRSVKEIADAIGIPCPYLEPVIDKMVQSEVMGRTAGGLVYTRICILPYRKSFGDVEAQETIAQRHAKTVWDTAWRHFEPLTHSAEVEGMTDKQKATLLLFFILHSIGKLIVEGEAKADVNTPKKPPVRPNGGSWLASAKMLEYGEQRDFRYGGSGPVQVGYSADNKHPTCRMFDFQSLFGDAHWGYHKFRYRFDLKTILRFYASLKNSDVNPEDTHIYEMIPEFERLHILRRDENGQAALDIPALPWSEDVKWFDAAQKVKQELSAALIPDLLEVYLKHDNRIPKHVDEAEYYRHAGGLSCYTPALLLSIVEAGLLPWKITVGKTPIIYVTY